MIYLLRHGDAENETSPDEKRRLTPKGERQSVAAGRALARLGASVDACLSSPKVRSVQTAQLACGALEVEVEVAEELRGGPFDPLELTAGRGDVLLVGHEPDFSNALAALTGARAKLKKGGMAWVEDRELQALLTPKQLSAIAG